jgi:hypothetical protein
VWGHYIIVSPFVWVPLKFHSSADHCGHLLLMPKGWYDFFNSWFAELWMKNYKMVKVVWLNFRYAITFFFFFSIWFTQKQYFGLLNVWWSGDGKCTWCQHAGGCLNKTLHLHIVDVPCSELVTEFLFFWFKHLHFSSSVCLFVSLYTWNYEGTSKSFRTLFF